MHTKPELNFSPITNAASPLTLSNLGSLNALGGKGVYLTSVDDITTNPAWLNGVKPDGSGKTNGAVSSAVIVNDKGDGTVDAFYMYFYAFNAGPPVLGQPVNNHVGDWEHTMVRFKNGQPQAMWFSQVCRTMFRGTGALIVTDSMSTAKPSLMALLRSKGNDLSDIVHGVRTPPTLPPGELNTERKRDHGQKSNEEIVRAIIQSLD